MCLDIIILWIGNVNGSASVAKHNAYKWLLVVYFFIIIAVSKLLATLSYIQAHTEHILLLITFLAIIKIK